MNGDGDTEDSGKLILRPAQLTDPIVFGSGAEFAQWLSSEQKLWNTTVQLLNKKFYALTHKVNLNNERPIQESANKRINILKTLTNISNDSQKNLSAKNFIEKWNVDNNIIISKSPYFTDVFDGNKNTESRLIHLFLGMGELYDEEEYSNPITFIRTIHKTLFYNVDDVEFLENTRRDLISTRQEWALEHRALMDQTEVDLAKWNTTRDEADQRIADLEHEIVQMQKSHAAQLHKISEEHSSTLSKIESDFLQRMELEAPVNYWKKKAEKHARSGLWARATFYTMAIAVISLAISLGHQYVVDAFTVAQTNGAATLYSGAVQVGLPALMVVWVMRILSRSANRQSDAEEDATMRATMAQTYLALLVQSDKAAKDEDRFLVLNALFRAGNSQAEDTPPPNLLDIIKQAATVKSTS